MSRNRSRVEYLVQTYNILTYFTPKYDSTFANLTSADLLYCHQATARITSIAFVMLRLYSTVELN